jgi:hypothetical protein
MLLAAQVWYFWLGLALFLGSVAVVVAVVVGYLVKVERPQYKGLKQ